VGAGGARGFGFVLLLLGSLVREDSLGLRALVGLGDPRRVLLRRLPPATHSTGGRSGGEHCNPISNRAWAPARVGDCAHFCLVAGGRDASGTRLGVCEQRLPRILGAVDRHGVLAPAVRRQYLTTIATAKEMAAEAPVSRWHLTS
jgi:hypothetical protein